jgi:CRAL/TRIO domain
MRGIARFANATALTFDFSLQLAVKRFVKYWEKRVEAFGPIHAFQPLTLDGPLKDDTATLDIGVLAIIRRKNARNILYFDPSKSDKTKYTRESALRAVWYGLHALLEDTEVQKRGVIALNYNANFRLSNRDPPLTKKCFSTLKGALPLRISAIHGTHVPYVYGCVIALVMVFLGERLRKRIIVHNGTNEEVIAALELYGISIEDIPIDMGGLLKLDISTWLENRRAVGL